MKSKFWKLTVKSVLWILLGLIILVVSIPFLLYVPFIQDFARKIAVEKVKEKTGMTVDVSYLRLHFPLNLEVDSLAVIEASGDTMVTAARADVSVKLMPLFHKEIEISSVGLRDAFYRMGTPDSAMYLTARISQFDADETDIPLDFSKINLTDAVLDGGDVYLALKDTVTAEKKDTAASKPLRIDAGNITLRNLRYRMVMLPTIDSLGAYIGEAKLTRGMVDTGRRLIDVGKLSVDSVTAAYLTPSAAWIKAHPAKADTVAAKTADPSEAWTIRAQQLHLTAREALYATRGVRPQPGFDAGYIKGNDIVIDVDSFYNRGTSIIVPLRHFAATERCGLSLMASGTFAMDSLIMQARKFNLQTMRSNIYLDASMGMGDLTKDRNIPLSLTADGRIAVSDVLKFMPSLRSYLAALPASAGLEINTDIKGTPASLAIDRLRLNLPGYLALKAEGKVDNPLEFNRISGRVNLDGTIGKLNSLKGAFLSKQLAAQVNIPPSRIKGNIIYSPGNIDGDVKVTTTSGDIALDGKWNDRAQGYQATLKARSFPVNAFMPGLGVGKVTADVNLNGRGYNPASKSTHMKADADLTSLEYQGRSLSDITLKATLDTCRLTAALNSANSYADLDADVAATFKGGGYQWDLSTEIRELDLQAMNLSKTPMHGRGSLYTTGAYYPRTGDISAEADLDNLHWVMDSSVIDLSQLTAHLSSTDSLTTATLSSGDLTADVTALTSVTRFIDRMQAAAKLMMAQVEKREINIDSLQRSMPEFSLTADMGRNNPVYQFITADSTMSFSHASIEASNDSLISLHAAVDELVTGKTRLDRVTFNANQHGKYLVYTANVDNQPGTMDDFAHVSLRGFLADDKLSAMIQQRNIQGKQGFLIGLNAAVSDSTVQVRFVPTTPTIAYKKWQLNADNHLDYNFVTRHFDGDLKLMSDSSYLRVYTEHVAQPDSIMQSGNGQEDIIVKLANINIADWLSISPFAPPIKGNAEADMRFRWNEGAITGNGTIGLDNLYYGRERVGTFRLDVDVANDTRTKALNADVALMIDGQKVITATGALNDSTSTSPFLLDFDMIHFPLRAVNPFLPKDMVQLAGMLNGKMKITGDMAKPVFNGYLDFDSSAVNVGMTGASYKFSEEKIPVDSNIVRFNNYTIGGLNNNDLYINGYVDARHISDIKYDLKLKASDMQIVKSDRARKGADVYGKAFIDLDATAKGNLNFMAVNADLNLLPETNVTYVLTEATQALASRSQDDMVHFVSFADTAGVAAADSLTQSGMAMLLNANLTISEGSTLNVDLSANGKNRVQIQGYGDFVYSLTPMNGSGRLTGRYTINSGFVRYTPEVNTGGISMAVMSEKNFSFREGSYVAFNGDILNPTLSIFATDRLKANVTQEGQNSRLVNFDVEVSITQTLENMNVAFNLTTDDDITIKNELETMSPDQRANQAMNLLLYNVYTGPGTRANANLSGSNPLYSFLASQLNTWAANNIRGVDISFGIDQYDTTTDGSKSTTTSYSYRVSKTLFNDRVKIVIGGNYSTDADADENFQQNLINDISFEYMLNRSGSMYVRIFRHVGWESILEGEITETGVGFVMKRKLNSLRDLFRFGSFRKSQAPEPATSSPVTNDETEKK